jgi:phosphoribosylaminoimidazole (AIR) synthetase
MNQYMNMGIGSIFIVSQEDSSLAKKLIPEAVIAGKVFAFLSKKC